MHFSKPPPLEIQYILSFFSGQISFPHNQAKIQEKIFRYPSFQNQKTKNNELKFSEKSSPIENNIPISPLKKIFKKLPNFLLFLGVTIFLLLNFHTAYVDLPSKTSFCYKNVFEWIFELNFTRDFYFKEFFS